MQLGFHQPLTRLYVFIKNEAGCLWYWLEDGRKNYIQENALTGVLRHFEVKEAETSFGDRLKADFEIVADRRYVLRSGVDSAFSRGMLMLIAALSDEDLRQPITLELKAGEEKGNVLVSGRDPESFEPIVTGKWENVNWESLMKSAIARLGGSVPQPQAKASYPQHNALIKSIRTVTGHSPEQIVGWCQQHGAQSPSELSPKLCDQLVEALCLGWGRQFFAGEQEAANSFREHVSSRVAAGEKKGDAIQSWIESIKAVPVSR